MLDSTETVGPHPYNRNRARPKLTKAPSMSAKQIHIPSLLWSWKEACHSISNTHPATQL
jgi:hypothetical protein